MIIASQLYYNLDFKLLQIPRRIATSWHFREK